MPVESVELVWTLNDLKHASRISESGYTKPAKPFCLSAITGHTLILMLQIPTVPKWDRNSNPSSFVAHFYKFFVGCFNAKCRR